MPRKLWIIVTLVTIIASVVNFTVYAQDEQPPQENPWGEVIDAQGNILFANLTDLGEIQVQEEWMPDIPFIEGQATYHRYLTPSGNIAVLPSASTLFFMASDPEASGYSDSYSILGNGLAIQEMMTAGYLSTEDFQAMGYADSNSFFQAIINGEENIWSSGGRNLSNFFLDLLSNSLADGNLYNAVIIYTADQCALVPGGCPTPTMAITPTTPPPSICQDDYIETGTIQVTGGSGDGGKIAPPNPIVIGQDPQQRGVDIQVNVLIPPVVYHSFEAIRHEELICVRDTTGYGTGCPEHPSDYRWTTAIDVWYECVEHIQIYPDYLETTQIMINLTPTSREWILTNLAQAFPGAHLIQPDFTYSFPGPGSVMGDQSISWSATIPNIPTADPGIYSTSVFVRTTGTPVSAPRQIQVGIGTFNVDLVNVSLIQQP